LKNYLRKWFSKEPWFERFFVEPEMVLLWHHSEEPFLVPGGTFIFSFFKGSLNTVIGYLKNSLRKWFFKEPWFERLFVEP